MAVVQSLRNKVTCTMRRKKIQYHDENITVNQSNPKQPWKVIGQLTGKKHNEAIPADSCASGYFSNAGANRLLFFCVNKNQSLVFRLCLCFQQV